MAALKLVSFICVAVLFSGVQSADSPRTLLAQLEGLVRNSTSAALNDVGALLDQVNQTAQGVIQEAEELIKNILDGVRNQTLGLVNKAEELGLDVTNCVQTSEDNIRALSDNLLLNVTLCVGNQVQNIYDFATNTTATINSELNKVSNYGDEIQACEAKSFLQVGACLAGVTLKISQEVVSIPAEIVDAVDGLRVYVSEALPSLAQCSEGIVDTLPSQASEILACISDTTNGVGI